MAPNLLLARVVLAAAALIASAGAAVAQPIVGLASVFQSTPQAVGNVLRGYGKVDSINGVPIRQYLCSNCELTYRFDNYIVSSISATEVRFIGGYINFYLDKAKKKDGFDAYTSLSSAEDLAAVTDGTLVLSLAGHAIDAAGNTLAGTGVNIGAASPVGIVAGLADVDLTGSANGNTAGPGGSWNARVNADGIAALFGGGNADLQFSWTAATTLAPHSGDCPAGPGCASGALDFRGLTNGPLN